MTYREIITKNKADSNQGHKITPIQIEYHRNGASGKPFHIIRFNAPLLDHKEIREMVALVFDTPKHIAVFDYVLLAKGQIAFGENSWHGDEFESGLRKAIARKYMDGKP